MMQSIQAAPQQENPRTPNMGEDFKIKDVTGFDVDVAIIERDGKQHIRSTYNHGWEREIRVYPISAAISSFSIMGSAIQVYFSTPGKKLVGAVYVINSHGEAVKVDDITQVDLTW